MVLLLLARPLFSALWVGGSWLLGLTGGARLASTIIPNSVRRGWNKWVEHVRKPCRAWLAIYRRSLVAVAVMFASLAVIVALSSWVYQTLNPKP